MVRKKNKPRSGSIDRETGLRYMYVLEQNEMNYNRTARELGSNRVQVSRWKDKYWDDYVKNKGKAIDSVQNVAAIKLQTNKEFELIRQELAKTFELALNRANDILNDPEKVETMSDKDLIQLINIILPYVIDKPVTLGANEPGAHTGQTTFVQNIIKKMNIKGYNNENSENNV